jgi:hypothetical protein
MKILAIIDVAPGAPIETIRAGLVNELKESWDIYMSGVLREAYATAEPSRVVFVLEANDISHAQEHLRRLPLVAAGHFGLELMELRPFVNWSRLFAP